MFADKLVQDTSIVSSISRTESGRSHVSRTRMFQGVRNGAGPGPEVTRAFYKSLLRCTD